MLRNIEHVRVFANSGTFALLLSLYIYKFVNTFHRHTRSIIYAVLTAVIEVFKENPAVRNSTVFLITHVRKTQRILLSYEF